MNLRLSDLCMLCNYFFVGLLSFLLISLPLSGRPKTLMEMQEYLAANNYEIKSLVQIKTNGATECSYYYLEEKCKNYFIKSGEKVDLEVKNYHQLAMFISDPLVNISYGSSDNEKIIILEYIDKPKYGFDLVDWLYTGKISAEEFILLQEDVFQAVSQLYQIPLPYDVSMSTMFSIRIKERLGILLEEQDQIQLFPIHMGLTRGISLRELLNISLVLKDQDGIKEHGSIIEMAQAFYAMMEFLPHIRKTVIHGDFHPPNVGCDKNIIKLLDLSDIKYGEDVTWDLGKWLNHVYRLHLVVARRTNGEADPEILLIDQKDSLIFEDRWSKPIGLDSIRKHAVSFFAKQTNLSENLIAVKAAAAEFVVNLNTLRRHLRIYPYATNRLLCCIVDSFHQFETEWREYLKNK